VANKESSADRKHRTAFYRRDEKRPNVLMAVGAFQQLWIADCGLRNYFISVCNTTFNEEKKL
jgi:hypothetical protein